MSELRRYHKYGECKTGTNNKYYEVEAQELENGRATWIFRWARIGRECSKPKEGESSSFEIARCICAQQWAKKSKYTEVNAMMALASAAEELHERPVNGYERVELTVPCFHAGKSEGRMKQFCLKYQYKLNVICASRWDMEIDTYEKQIKVLLKQYCAEFKRIKGSKTHGPNIVSFADTAFRMFFAELRDNTGCTVYGYFEGVGLPY